MTSLAELHQSSAITDKIYNVQEISGNAYVQQGDIYNFNHLCGADGARLEGNEDIIRRLYILARAVAKKVEVDDKTWNLVKRDFDITPEGRDAGDDHKTGVDTNSSNDAAMSASAVSSRETDSELFYSFVDCTKDCVSEASSTMPDTTGCACSLSPRPFRGQSMSSERPKSTVCQPEQMVEHSAFEPTTGFDHSQWFLSRWVWHPQDLHDNDPDSLFLAATRHENDCETDGEQWVDDMLQTFNHKEAVPTDRILTEDDLRGFVR